MLLLRHDTPAPVCAVQLIAESCIHESLSIRKVSIKVYWYVCLFVSPFLQTKITIVTSCLLPWMMKTFQNRVY